MNSKRKVEYLSQNANNRSGNEYNQLYVANKSNSFSNNSPISGNQTNSLSKEEGGRSGIVPSNIAKIKVMGVGGGGCNAVDRMIESEVVRCPLGLG